MLETIHSRCPLLIKFKMFYCVILLSEEEALPKKIVPTLRLSRILIDRTAICDQRCIFLAYLTQKYTKLVQVRLELSFSGNQLKLLFPGQTTEQMRSSADYIAKRNGLQATSKSYTTSASSILSNLPSTLKSVMIFSPDIYNAMIISSKQCVNITHISFLSPISACDNIFTSPEDIGMFKNLPFLQHLSVVLDQSMQSYRQAPASTSLTTLNTIIKGASPMDDMDIGWLLSMFPSLTDLNIEYSGTRLAGYENSSLEACSALNKISIGPGRTHPNMIKFICGIAPNLCDLFWCVSGKAVKDELTKRHPNQAIVIQPNEPKMENGRSIYTIDLTGLYLNCFHLEIDLRARKQDKNGDIILDLIDKHSKHEQFIISEDFKCVYLATYCNRNIKEEIKTEIKIQYDYTKMITINSDISINLKESQIQLNYSH